MNKRPYSIAVFMAALAAAACTAMPGPARYAAAAIRVMTFNIRMNSPSDGPNAWPLRKELAAGTIAFQQAHIAGLQEVLLSQLEDLRGLLPGYDWVGVGRDDGKEAGEFNPIFFLRDRFRLLESSTFWLSEHPGRPGLKGWDAACARVVTWARLKDLWTGATLVAFNTHFDHVGETARRESAALVLAEMRRIAAGAPVVLTGDFNCTRDDPAYRTLVGPAENDSFLRDTRDVSALAPYGPSFSFNGFKADVQGRWPIDHIFVGRGVAVLRAGVLPGTWEGRFVSDHNPVLAEIRLARR